jgi:hypothetical protein
MYKEAKKIYLLLTVYPILILSCIGANPIYISTVGADSGNGTLKHPFLTLGKARDFLRIKRLSGEKGPYSILLKGGNYYFPSSVKFDERDKELTISPYKNEIVRFTGGITIDPRKAKLVVGSPQENIFPKNKRSHILMVDLKEIGITNYGELEQVGYGHHPVCLWMELFINGKPCHLSRWPNDSTIAIGKVIDNGLASIDKKSEPHGGKFIYPGNRPSKWKASNDIWIFGYFKYGWADDAVKLASIDTLEKKFTTAQPHNYGFSSGAPWNAWYAYNIPEEIDAPGEYYIDRKEGILYFYNPGKIERLEVSVLADPFIVIEKAEKITIQGITFDCARGIGVDIKSCTQCILKDCTIQNLGSYAINISDINGIGIGKKNGLVNCSIYQTGEGGVHLGGGNRQSLEPAENYVENCSIHDFNRIVKTYCAGVQISGVGNRISHCEIFNAPHVAILLSGNNHLIEYNNIHDVCLSTDDVGALYYGRDPSMRGHLVQFNYFHELGKIYHTSAVYHDDGACGMNVFGNVFYKAGTLPSLIGGGSDNSYANNIFIDSPLAIHIDNRLHSSDWIKPGNLFENELIAVKYNQPPYSIKYPELARYFEDDLGVPIRNRIENNVFVRIKKVIDGYPKFLDYSDNNFVTDEDPGFVSWKDQNFKLKKTSEIFKKIPGFQQIPFEKIGIVK